MLGIAGVVNRQISVVFQMAKANSYEWILGGNMP